MGYYLRASCTSEDLPPLGRVLEWAAAQGVSLALEGLSPGLLDSAGWREAELRYKPGRQPLVVDVSRAGDDGYDAVGVFLGFFVEHCGGMVQADAEGFYEGGQLIVELA